MIVSIQLRLAVALAALALLCGIQGVVTLHAAFNSQSDLAKFRTDVLPSIIAVNRIQDATSEVRIKQYRLLALSKKPEDLAVNLRQYEAAQKTISAFIHDYQATIVATEKRELFARFLQNWQAYQAAGEEVYRMFVNDGRQAEALAEIDRNRPLFDLIRSELENIVSAENEDASKLAARSAAMAASTMQMAWICMIAAGLAAFITAALSFRDISRPIATVTAYMKRLAAGDMLHEVPFARRRDEIGAMAAAVQVFRARMIQNTELEHEAIAARDKLVAERKSVMREMADHFERIMSAVVSGTAARAADMRATSAQLASTAAETAQRSATVATAALETAGSASSVADAAHALGRSVQTIYEQVQGSSSLAHVAANEAHETETLIQELVTGAAKIGDIVSMISTIASQTNLLALNAAIEAAAAGANGRGFAVVALEVKALAKQTSQATADIAEQIGRIQSSTGQTVDAIRRIAGRITEISERAVAISDSVGIQQTAARNIIESIEMAAEGTHQVTGNITYVASAADATGVAANRVLDMASDLAGQSELLRAEVDRFLSEVRAA